MDSSSRGKRTVSFSSYKKKNKLTTFLFATPFNILAILLHILMERTKLLLINQFSSYYEMIF